MSYSLLTDDTGAISSFAIDGRDAVGRAINLLLDEGMEFHVEPLPDDEWDITVKLADQYRMAQIEETVSPGNEDEDDDGLVLIAGILYDAETLEEEEAYAEGDD